VSVLIVDDQPANLMALEATLNGLDVDLVLAPSGFEALRCLLNQDFALILMDVKMPGMDGFETAELIRGRKRCAHTPIIFLTASESTDRQIFEGYTLGAVDYLVKPIVSQVLRSKVSVFTDIFRQTDQIKRQAELLCQMEQREHQRQLAEAKARFETERLHEEMRIARAIQQKLFPIAPVRLRELDIAGASLPAAATGGDYFDFIPMQDGGLTLVVGDVCGHGFGPALMMAELRAYLRAFVMTCSDLGKVLGLLNRALADDMEGFVTLLAAKIDPRTRALTYAGAGHLPGYLLDSTGNVKAQLESTGIPLAVMSESSYPTETAPALEPGEMVLLLTDGIIEAHRADEELLGINRVLKVIKANRHLPARQILSVLYESVRDFCCPAAQLDDMTAIIIKAEE
jgi:serine phosphatase RsbU (regulator of sigma subunit)